MRTNEQVIVDVSSAMTVEVVSSDWREANLNELAASAEMLSLQSSSRGWIDRPRDDEISIAS